MLILAIAMTLDVKTIRSTLGDMNYLYQKPENAGKQFNYDVSPDLLNFTIFLRAGTVISDV